MSVQPIVRGANDGAVVGSPIGAAVAFIARAQETGGSLTAMTSLARAGQGPPLHVHLHEDEFIYVLEGRLLVRLDEALHDAPVGAFTFIPRGVPHTWQNVGDGPARFLFGFTPGSPAVERFFERTGELPGARRAEAFTLFAGEAGIEMVGPPLGAMRGT